MVIKVELPGNEPKVLHIAGRVNAKRTIASYIVRGYRVTVIKRG